MRNKIAKGQWTGLCDYLGNDILAGSTLRNNRNGELWDINTYQQAVPRHDGKAVDVAELIRKEGNALEVVVALPESEANGTEAEQVTETKVCPECGRTLPVSAFGKHAKTKDGLQPVCRECRSKKMQGKKRPRKEKTEPLIIKVETEGVAPLATYDATELVAELRARGWEVKCTRTRIEEI